MAKEKTQLKQKMNNPVPVFVLDNTGLSDLYDSFENPVKNPQLHGIYVADANHPEIGNKLFSVQTINHEEVQKAIDKYALKVLTKKSTKSNNKPKKKTKDRKSTKDD